MSEILPGVHQVEGIDPLATFTTHVFLVKDQGNDWSLIDTGLPGSHPGILSYAAKVGIAGSSIKRILVTHLHRDHVGSLKMMTALTGAKSMAHWIEAAYIAQSPKYDGPGTPPAEPVTVGHELGDGDRIEGHNGLIAYHTPGHTPGHMCYYDSSRKILFSGDLFVGDGSELRFSPEEASHHMQTLRISARRVASLPIDALLTYHGGPFLERPTRLLARLVQVP